MAKNNNNKQNKTQNYYSIKGKEGLFLIFRRICLYLAWNAIVTERLCNLLECSTVVSKSQMFDEDNTKVLTSSEICEPNVTQVPEWWWSRLVMFEDMNGVGEYFTAFETTHLSQGRKHVGLICRGSFERGEEEQMDVREVNNRKS